MLNSDNISMNSWIICRKDFETYFHVVAYFSYIINMKNYL